jgi:hypothetical protein
MKSTEHVTALLNFRLSGLYLIADEMAASWRGIATLCSEPAIYKYESHGVPRCKHKFS